MISWISLTVVKHTDPGFLHLSEYGFQDRKDRGIVLITGSSFDDTSHIPLPFFDRDLAFFHEVLYRIIPERAPGNGPISRGGCGRGHISNQQRFKNEGQKMEGSKTFIKNPCFKRFCDFPHPSVLSKANRTWCHLGKSPCKSVPHLFFSFPCLFLRVFLKKCHFRLLAPFWRHFRRHFR